MLKILKETGYISCFFISILFSKSKNLVIDLLQEIQYIEYPYEKYEKSNNSLFPLILKKNKNNNIIII